MQTPKNKFKATAFVLLAVFACGDSANVTETIEDWEKVKVPYEELKESSPKKDQSCRRDNTIRLLMGHVERGRNSTEDLIEIATSHGFTAKSLGKRFEESKGHVCSIKEKLICVEIINWYSINATCKSCVTDRVGMVAVDRFDCGLSYPEITLLQETEHKNNESAVPETKSQAFYSCPMQIVIYITTSMFLFALM